MLLFVLIVSVGTLFADTETVPVANGNWEGTSISLKHEECANGSVSVMKDNTGMNETFYKLRTNKNNNTITLYVNAGYSINEIYLRGYSNNTTSEISLIGVSIDGVAEKPFTSITFPSKNSGYTDSYSNTACNASDSIVLTFDNSEIDPSDNSNKYCQIMAQLTVTYEAEKVEVDGLYYEIDTENKTAKVTYEDEWSDNNYSGLTSANIPSSITYNSETYSVKSIGNYAFYGCSSLTSIEIPDSVTSIGSYAFRECSGLRSVAIPNTVTNIENYAFYNCSSLTSVTINSNAIAYNKYYTSTSTISSIFGTQVKEYIIGDSVTSIGSYAFAYCIGLSSVTIPNSVTNIGDYAFEGCTGLTSVNIHDIASWCAILFGNSSSNPLNYANNLYISDELITNLVIPNTITSLGNYTFYNCSSLKSVTIPNSVTSIESSTFKGCSGLTSVTINSNAIVSKTYTYRSTISSIFGTQVQEYIIGDSVTSIGKNAFYFCSNLTSVTIGNSVTSIEDYAFEGCSSITSVVWNAKDCNSYNFGSQVEVFTFGNEVEVIPASICSGMNKLNSITIPSGVTSIGNYAFNGCGSITLVVWNAKDCNSYNFGSQVEVFTFGNEVEVVPASICSGMNKLNSITIPNRVTSIGDYSFKGCSSLTSIDIPNSVTSIGNEAFSNCSNLTDIYVPCGEMERFQSMLPNDYRVKYFVPYSISTKIEHGIIDVYACEGEEYAQLTVVPDNGYHFAQWSDGVTDNPRKFVLTQDTTFTAEIAADTNGQCGDNLYWSLNDDILTITGSGDMWQGQPWVASNEAIKQVNLPQGLTSIGNRAFYYCSNLSSIEIPDSVKRIDYQAFRSCAGLTSIEIPNSIESIGAKTFYDCTSLTSVIIPNSITRIEEGTFYGCSNLSSVAIGNSVSYIGYEAFRYCSKLSSLEIPNSVETISSKAFRDCSNIISVVWNAKNCNGWNFGSQVTSFTFGNEVEVIPASICSGMNQLTIMTIPNSVTKIETKAFYNCSGFTKLTLGSGLQSIGENAFAYCKNFDDITCYAATVPRIYENTFYEIGNKQYIYLFVPEGRQRAYLRDTYWGEFDVQIKKAESTTVQDENVTINPTDNSAEIIWPAVANTQTYEIAITKGGDTICTLVFNEQGQLNEISFAPARYERQTQNSGFRFTITSLTSGTTYDYSVIAKDELGNPIDTKSGSFTTTGVTTALDQINDQMGKCENEKILRDGQILILRGEKVYTVTGYEVK